MLNQAVGQRGVVGYAPALECAGAAAHHEHHGGVLCAAGLLAGQPLNAAPSRLHGVERMQRVQKLQVGQADVVVDVLLVCVVPHKIEGALVLEAQPAADAFRCGQKRILLAAVMQRYDDVGAGGYGAVFFPPVVGLHEAVHPG